MMEYRREIRIDRDKAIRIIAQMLRDGSLGLSSAAANEQATAITDRLVAAMTTPKKPGLADWRMIPRSPPTTALAAIIGRMQERRTQAREHEGESLIIDADRLWTVVWEHGRNPPKDIDMTDT